MREIKFRSWDKDAKKMLFFLSDWHIDCEYNKLSFWCDNDKGTELSGDKDKYIIMQYTGLKDKNGKEIYEGDIIDKGYGNTYETIDEINVVEMGTGEDSDGYYHGKWYGWKAGESSLLDVNEECKVVGNIYENPELLNNK